MANPCQYPIALGDVVKHDGSRFYVFGETTDPLGTATELGGNWSEDRTSFTGTVAMIRSGARTTAPLTLRKLF